MKGVESIQLWPISQEATVGRIWRSIEYTYVAYARGPGFRPRPE